MQMLDGKTPRVTNSNAGGNRAEDDCGVAVDGLTASLLGIHFLPFTPLPGGDGAALPDNSALQQHRHRQHEYSHLLPALPAMTTSPQQEATRGHRSTPNDTNGGANLYFSDLGDNSTLTEDPADAVGRSKRGSSGIGGSGKVGKSSRKRIKGAFKSIKKSIVRGSRSKKAGVGTAATDADVLGRGTNATSISSSPASGGGQSPISMSSSSADLSRLQSSADEATRRARALTERIESKTEEITALERKLASCREALARDVADLDSLREDIDALQRRRREVERSNADSSGGGASSRPNAQTATVPVSSQPQQLKPKPEAVRRLSSFIRIHDLDLAQDAGTAAATGQGLPPSNAGDSSADGSGNKNILNRAYSLSVEVSEVQTGSTRPDLADVHGSTIAPAIVEALARMAYDAATDDATDRWTPSADTKKALGKQTDLVSGSGSHNASVLVSAGGAPWIHVPPKEVFVWHGKFEHGGFGSDLPVVKARGLVFCSAQELVSLLLDSTRTKEYNKMSIGRTDEHYFHRNALPGVTDEMPGAAACGNETNTEDDTCWEELPGETRILRSLSKPPMVKPVELLTLYHARELDAAAGQIDGYLIVSRSIWETECGVPTEGGGGKKSDSSATRTEMLLGAQLVRSVDNADRPQCELTTINHLSSKSIPMMMAKKVGLMTAASFIRDIQGVFE